MHSVPQEYAFLMGLVPGESVAAFGGGACTDGLFAGFHRCIDCIDALHCLSETEAFSGA